MKLTLCLFIVMGSMAVPLSAQEPNLDTVTTIGALEHQWADAQSRNDNRSLDLIFDNELVYVEYGRLISKGEYLSRVKREIPTQDSIAMETFAVKTFGKTALAIGSYREKQLRAGHSEFKRWRFIDTWVYKNHCWKLAAAAAAPIQ